MDTSNLKLCVICCAGFNSKSTVESDALLCREHLVNFCKLLANSPPKQNEEFDTLLQKSFPGMDAFFVESRMSVCVECHHQITIALEKGREAEKREEEVRRLQKQILEQMKELQKQLDEFHDEMGKVEKVIQTSDVSCLMYHMAKNPTKNEDATNGIVLIRDRILDVMADLREFQSRQKNILNFDLEKFLRGHECVPIYDEEEDDDYIPYMPQPECIIGTEGLMEADVAPVFLGHTVFTAEGDYRYEDSSKVNGNDVDDDDDFSAAEDDSDDSDDEVEYIPPKNPSITPAAATIANKHPIPNFSVPVVAGPAVGSRTGTTGMVATVPGPGPSVYSGSTGAFKKEFINRAIRREENRRKEEESSLDPLIRHTVKYNSRNGKLTVDNFEIIVDERLRTLQCVTCGFSRRESKRVGGSLDLEWKLKVHIISSHVGFKCLSPGCTFECSNHPTFLGHLKQNHNNNPAKPLPARNSANFKRVANNNNIRPVQNAKPPPTPSTRSSPRNQQPPARASNNSSNNNNVRTCPVSTCKKTYTKKEEFIRHLQEHRQQNKMQRKTRAVPCKEPEIVVLD